MADAPVILSCVNLKGGVGKTTIAVNFAAYCGLQGLKTLLIDLDPQTNATFSCISVEDWQSHAAENGTVANLLGLRTHTSAEGKAKAPDDVIVEGVFKNVDLIPSHLDLFTIDLDLGGASARETLLRRALKDVLPKYDVVVCDCPPNLTIPTQNALAMSTHYVVPVSPDFLSSLGIGLLLSRVQKLTGDLEHKIENAGIVISRVGRRSYYREQTIQTLREQFGTVLNSSLNERSAVSEITEKHRPVFETADGKAISEFKALGAELMESLGLS
ncbi:MAG TPA: ParA family protein [Phenylobacterium sp.]|jgi:chromosome partitioning protein|uniref:ParA family protein n=1 Tax=Phenylobacterium sp. TaxID=1871053 RepID=UPI002C1E551B|nr:ParA family protein [Phenylobacterium sp.]HXA39206.1 ParA family protein [Phenylobacterium sp.]